MLIKSRGRKVSCNTYLCPHQAGICSQVSSCTMQDQQFFIVCGKDYGPMVQSTGKKTVEHWERMSLSPRLLYYKSYHSSKIWLVHEGVAEIGIEYDQATCRLPNCKYTS